MKSIQDLILYIRSILKRSTQLKNLGYAILSNRGRYLIAACRQTEGEKQNITNNVKDLCVHFPHQELLPKK